MDHPSMRDMFNNLVGLFFLVIIKFVYVMFTELLWKSILVPIISLNVFVL